MPIISVMMVTHFDPFSRRTQFRVRNGQQIRQRQVQISGEEDQGDYRRQIILLRLAEQPACS